MDTVVTRIKCPVFPRGFRAFENVIAGIQEFLEPNEMLDPCESKYAL